MNSSSVRSSALLVCSLLAPSAAAQVQAGWLEQVSAELERRQYDFSVLGPDLWSAPNPSQELVSRVGRDGLELVSHGLQLETRSLGRAGNLRILECRGVTVSGARAELDHGALVEWFVNHEQGLEQGWTISERPAGSSAQPLVIGLGLEGELELQLDECGSAGLFVDETGEARLRYGDLLAWDATGRELAVSMAERPGGVELHVDDRGAVYPLVVDPLILNFSWAVEANQALSSLGMSVSNAGDVNGDGYSDVIVGAPGWDGTVPDEGRAFVYHGSATGLSLTAAWSVAAGISDAQFGMAVSSAGDVNGDGFDDVVVGAERYSNGESNEGRADVYHGSAAGLSTSAAWSVETDLAFAAFGNSVSSAGDVNGDGFDDLIVGAFLFSGGQTAEGRAYVFRGSAAGLGTSASWTAESNQAFATFGQSVSGAGDVNGDGFDDVIVGANGYDNGEVDEGRAFVYHGSATGLAAAQAWTVESNQATAWLGFSVAGAGDVNGDGYADVIVGASRFDNGQVDEGRATVYLGSGAGLATTAAWTAELDLASVFFGSAVASAGDVNGDGYDDVVVGAPSYSNDEPEEGGTFVYPGSAAGLLATPAWSAESNQMDAQLGSSVGGGGDVNGDGIADVVAGAPVWTNGESNEGRACAYHGFADPVTVPYCPAGSSAAGCTPLLSSVGAASASTTSGFTLISSGVEGSRDGLFFFGTNGRQENSWGNSNSFQCVVPPVSRAGLLAGVGTAGVCDGVLVQDLNALWCPACPKPLKNPGAGAVVQAQLWYRDPQSTSNQTTSLSHALEFTVAP